MNTKETKTLPIKGLQPPAASQAIISTENPNAEEIKLAPQRLRAGDDVLFINVELPGGYHLNPSAPQRYKVSVETGAQVLGLNQQDASRSAKGLTLPVRIPVRASGAGAAELRVALTFVYCREDNTGTCRIKTLVWRAPVEVVNDTNAAGEIRLSGRVTAE